MLRSVGGQTSCRGQVIDEISIGVPAISFPAHRVRQIPYRLIPARCRVKVALCHTLHHIAISDAYT